MEPTLPNHNVRPFRAHLDPADRVNIAPPDDYEDNYLQTAEDESPYDRGWADGFRAQGRWLRAAAMIAVSMLLLAAAIVSNTPHR